MTRRYPKASPYSKMRSSSFLSKAEAVLTSSGRSEGVSVVVAGPREPEGPDRGGTGGTREPPDARHRASVRTLLLGEALTFAAIVGLVLIVAGAEITPYESPAPGARRRDKDPSQGSSQGSSSFSLGLGARKVPPFHAASYLSCPAGRSSLVNPARVRPAYRR